MAARRTILASLSGLGLLVAGSALGHQTAPVRAGREPPAADVSGVTVTAEKPDPLVDRTTQFVRQHLPTSRNEQYGRFRDPVCVNVLGLPAEFDGFVARRVVEVARQVGAPVAAQASCKPNVNVIFSAQPQAQLTDIAKRRDVLFGYVFKGDAKAMATFSRPVQGWYLTRTVGTAGDSTLEINTGPECISSYGLNTPPCDIKGPLMGKAGSRLGNDMSSELVHSLIIADANKVAGQKIDAVADYIAVLALSRWQGLEHCNGGGATILDLMADGCDDRPDGATPTDLALLTALYSVSPRESGTQQRAEIARALRNTVAGADKDPSRSSR